ncbi:MAG: hypothetical protein ACK559_20790, partial [bacterium]
VGMAGELAPVVPADVAGRQGARLHGPKQRVGPPLAPQEQGGGGAAGGRRELRPPCQDHRRRLRDPGGAQGSDQSVGQRWRGERADLAQDGGDRVLRVGDGHQA